MAIRESVINPPTRGAGRTVDVCYPAPQNQPLGGVTASSTALNRQNYQIFTWGTLTSFGAPPAPQWVLYRGRIAYHFTGNGAAGGFWSTNNISPDFLITFPQTRLTVPVNDDCLNWRIVAILAYDAGLGAGDTGLEVGSGMQGQYNLVSSVLPGFRVGPSGPNSAVFQVKQNNGGALTINQTISTTLDTTDYNAYELRFIGATDKRDALVKCFLNGIQVAQASYGAGTLLPPFLNGAAMGFGIGIGNRGATGAYVPLCGLQVAAAATEDALL